MQLSVLQKDSDKARDAIPSTAVCEGKTFAVRRMIADLSGSTITAAGTLETTLAKIFVPLSCGITLRQGQELILDGQRLKVAGVTLRPTDGGQEANLTGFEE